MNRKKFNYCFLLLVGLLCITLKSIAQQPSNIYLGYKMEGHDLVVKTQNGDIVFRPFADNIIETSVFENGFATHDSSTAVIMEPEKVNAQLVDAKNELSFVLPEIQVKIIKNPFNIQYFFGDKLLFIEQEGYYKNSEGVGLRFKIAADEKFYGSGGRASGLDLRGQKLDLYNRAQYAYTIGAVDLNYQIPLLMSSKNYMILFDNTQRGGVDIDSQGNGILDFHTIGGQMRYFVLAGRDKHELLNSYFNLTGYQPMPPIWTFGNLQSRMAYRNQVETDSIVNLMLENDYPVDAVIIDFYWFGDSIQGYLGNLDWYQTAWPEPEEMIRKFKEKGVKTILISEPYIIDTLKNYPLAAEADIFVKDSMGNVYLDTNFYFGNGTLIDIFKPQAGDWLWTKYKKQFDQGVAGLWGDIGEPESHPSDIVHINGKADVVHNIYGHYWTKSIYDRFRRDFPDRRLFFLARSGAAGTQRYGIIPWSGDVSRSWEGLQAQLPAMLNMSLSGLPYMHSDAGGFALGEKDEELYTRWLQFATFSPVLRPHGSDIPSEAVYFNDTTQTIVRDFMKLRYRIMPYIYTAAWKTSTEGSPIVAPLLFYAKDDIRFDKDFSGYYFGDQIIVYPVVNKGQKTMEIMLPKGEWYNFWTGCRIMKENLTVNLSLNEIPVFVKAGSVIPLVDYYSSTDYYSSNYMFLNVYLPFSEGLLSGEIYEDDGVTYDAFDKGFYRLIKINGKASSKNISLNMKSHGSGFDGMEENGTFELTLMGFNGNIDNVILDGDRLTYLKKGYENRDDNGFWKDDKDLWHIRFPYDGQNETLMIQTK